MLNLPKDNRTDSILEAVTEVFCKNAMVCISTYSNSMVVVF